MIHCAITYETLSIQDCERWIRPDLDIVQLRAKSLSTGCLYRLAHGMQDAIRARAIHGMQPPKLFVNARADIALAVGAHGVHLTSSPNELLPDEVRRLFAKAGRAEPLISASTHSAADVERCRSAGANILLFGPVFEKRVDSKVVVGGVGLQALHNACVAARGLPVLAIGGVTQSNAALCLEAGAAGIAGIRFFQ